MNESEITSSNKPKPDYIYPPSKNDSNSIQFEIDKLIYGNYYFEVITTTLDKQIIDYNLLSYNLKKKSKWWIALIVIGILLILAGVGFILWKFYFKKKPETNKKDENNNKFNEITPTPTPIYDNNNQKEIYKSNSTFSKENMDEKEI